jgi:serine protease Do
MQSQFFMSPVQGWVGWLGFAWLITIGGTACVLGQEADPRAAALVLQQAIVEVVAEAETTVVAIARVKPEDEGPLAPGIPDAFIEPIDPTRPDFVPDHFGAGVVIDPQGLILTTAHVVGDPTGWQYYVWSQKRPYVAQVVAADPWFDLAVLKIEAEGLAAVRWGDAETVQKGQFVLALGNPYAIARDGDASVSWGVISNRYRPAPALPKPLADAARRPTLHHFGTLLQTDLRLPVGYSGGALLNLRGELIGLTTSYTGGPGFEQAAGLAIPVNAALRRVVDELKQGRRPEYGFLGIVPELLTTAARQQGQVGIQVGGVIPGTPAAVAGLQFGDRLTSLNGQPLRDEQDVIRVVASLPPETVVQIEVVRSSRESRPVKRSVVLTKRYATQPPYGTQPLSYWRGILLDYSTASPTFAIDGPNLDPQGCIYISEVLPDSPAWKAGLRSGLYITHVGTQRVTQLEACRTALAGFGDRPTPLRAVTGRDQAQNLTVSP